MTPTQSLMDPAGLPKECLACEARLLSWVQLPCGHQFCAECLREWGREVGHATCQNCHAQLGGAVDKCTVAGNQVHRESVSVQDIMGVLPKEPDPAFEDREEEEEDDDEKEEDEEGRSPFVRIKKEPPDDMDMDTDAAATACGIKREPGVDGADASALSV